MKHTVNGDQANGWYCYVCPFFSRNVEEAAKHDGVSDDDLKRAALLERSEHA